MPLIILKTRIRADRQICFDLARDIDMHQKTTRGTREKAVAGVTSGWIQMGETVTWEATHFGIRQRLTSKITAFDAPYHFRDTQMSGPFKLLQHDHYFENEGCYTVMTDKFRFESPGGLMGRVFNFLVLTRYMRRFLARRNALLKAFAEGGNDHHN